jgi:dihydrofolate synthase/folylpolyglutamate synthase
VNTLAYLASLEQFGIKLGLDQIRVLIEHLGRPGLEFRSIVVAGTNGKGSVTAMIERGLRAAGFRTGRYISPHLVRLEERFAIDGDAVSPHELDVSAARIRHAADRLVHPPSYFEATTAIAFDLFRDAGVEIAVLEVGLGGRLDATNVVDPMAVAITAIDFDHEAHLGSTIEQIAAEKAGVVKRGAIAVLGRNSPAVEDVVRRAAAAAGARFVSATAGVVADVTMVEGRAEVTLKTPRDTYTRLRLALRGRHQVDNAVTAVRLLEEISAHGIAPVPAGAIRTSVTDVVWPARLELVRWRGHEVLIDGAHNPAGARALAAFVRETYAAPVPFVVGAMKDKKIEEVIRAMAPAASHFVFTAPATERAAGPDTLLDAARTIAPEVPASAVPGALAALGAAAALGHLVVVAGSLYLAGEIRHAIAPRA